MKRKHVRLLAAGALISVLLPSCVDKNYDLENIDGDLEVSFENLTLPLNVQDIDLSTIIDLDENDPNSAVKLVNGEYCVLETGTFKSNPVQVSKVSLTCDIKNPADKEFNAGTDEYPAVWDPDYMDNITLTIGSDPTGFELNTSDVPTSITAIEEVTSDLRINISMGLKGLDDKIAGFTLHGAAGPKSPFHMLLPKGLKEVSGIGSYDGKTGVYTVPATHFQGTQALLTIKVGRINFEDSNVKFNPATHSIEFAGNISIDKNTKILLDKNDLPKTTTTLPSKIYYFTHFEIPSMNLKTFTGEVRYDEIDIPGISLDGLPDMLSGEARVKLANPQIYLSVENPFYDKKVDASTQMQIIACRYNAPSQPYVMDKPLQFKQQQKTNYVLCPKPAEVVSNPYLDYPGAFKDQPVDPQTFSSLGDILYGDRLPDSLDIDIDNTLLKVTDFEFGENIDAITGSYCFFAPLQLSEGSMLVYEGESNDWGEDIENLDIKLLQVDANVTTDIPMAFSLKAYPIDSEGKKLPGVEDSVIEIPANAAGDPVTFRFEGNLKGLNGIAYKAVINAKDGAALNNKMKLGLKNFKITVTGKYITDID